MIGTIVVPLDGSEQSEAALPAALTIARRAGARLHLVHVRTMEWLIAPPEEEEADPERSYLHRMADRVSAEIGRPVTTAVLPEEPPVLLTASPSPKRIAEMLAGNARDEGADLIVSTTHGRGGLSRLWFGSVAEAMLRAVTTPLLLVRPGQAEGWEDQRPRHLLVPLDPNDESSHAVLPAALDLGVLLSARFTVMAVLTPLLPFAGAEAMPFAVPPALVDIPDDRPRAERGLEAAAASMREAGADVSIVVLMEASPARAILRFAEDHNVDAIALATRARTGVDRMLLGSVADKLIRGAEVPLLLVIPPHENPDAG
jgi:nucleotide-binding universal stress UspA family protein